MLSPRTGSRVPGRLRPIPSTGGTDAVEQVAQALGDLGHQLVGPDTDLVVAGVRGQLLTVEVEDGELAAGAADGHGQDDTGVLVEDQGAGRAATGRGELLAEQQQARRRSAS